MGKIINGREYTTVDEIINKCVSLTDEDKAEIELMTNIVGKLIQAREEKNLSQEGLSKASGVKQPHIARLESMKTTPRITTLFKVLKPLGYTIDIVPIRKPRKKKV